MEINITSFSDVTIANAVVQCEQSIMLEIGFRWQWRISIHRFSSGAVSTEIYKSYSEFMFIVTILSWMYFYLYNVYFQYRILAGGCWNAVCGNNTRDGDESRSVSRSPPEGAGGSVHTHLLGPGARTSSSYTDLGNTETRVRIFINICVVLTYLFLLLLFIYLFVVLSKNRHGFNLTLPMCPCGAFIKKITCRSFFIVTMIICTNSR